MPGSRLFLSLVCAKPYEGPFAFVRVRSERNGPLGCPMMDKRRIDNNRSTSPGRCQE